MPYGDDIFIEKFSKLIKTLKEKNIKCEIVINDIGCLEYLIRDKNEASSAAIYWYLLLYYHI